MTGGAKARFFDQPRVMEAIPEGLEGFRLRVVGAYYWMRDFWKLLVSHVEGELHLSTVRLLREYPSMEDYCHVLRAVAAAAGGAVGSQQFNQCMAVLTMWAVGIAKGSLK